MVHICTTVVASVIACALGWSARAQAQPAPPPEPPALMRADETRPWALAVSPAEQAIATQLYAEGNHEFTESHFAQALARYKEAIGHWDHPAIRYNMAICLINLDQPVEAQDSLEKSLAFGPAPLGADVYAQGVTYRKLLHGQLGHVRISCQEPGAEVTLDGAHLFTGPGALEQFLLPRAHQVTVTRPGFLTASKTLVLAAGALTTYDVPMLELKPTARIVRRWATWKPWAVLAGGVALAGLGTGGYYLAKRDFEVYDARVERHCGGGCDTDELAATPSIGARRSRAELEQVIAFSLFTVGGATVAAAVIGVVLNQPRVQLESIRARPSVTPVPGGASASLTWSY